MIFKKVITLFSFAICLISTNAYSQLDNQILSTELPIHAKDTNKLIFSFNSLNFLRNTEYFGPIEFGKTLFGYSLQPKLVYYPSSFVRIDIGGIFRKDFGTDEFTILAPTYSIKISKNGYSGIFGNYEGGMSHQFIEPLFNIDYAITKPLENGLQFKINKKRLFSDTWIDWQRMIYQGSPFKEEISAGTSNLITIFGADKKFKISIPLQGIVHHFGGQIDTARTAPLSTLVNLAGGLRFSVLFAENSFVKELRSDNYLVTFHDGSPKKIEPYEDGYGIYLNLLVRTKLLNVMASYWNGEYYMAPNGTQIYGSLNPVEPTVKSFREDSRQLLFFRVFYEKKLYQGLNLEVRYEPFYEFSRKTVDFSYSIYLRYNLDAKLAHIKRDFSE